jgi:hypothetical protein
MVDDPLTKIPQQYFAIRTGIVNSSKRQAYSPDEIHVPLNILKNVDHSKGNPRFAGRIGSIKAKQVAGSERTLRTPTARSILSDAGNTPIPSRPQKTFDAEGEALEHALTRSFRIRNEPIKGLVFLRLPLQGRYHQGRMQKRLSARSSRFVESSRSGGGSDSGLRIFL